MSKIVVCIATYRGDTYINQQIDSILPQLNEDDILIVSDDGSNDATVALLESYGNKLNIVSIERVGGVVANFERVLTAAKGDIIVLCDQDDVWLPGRLDLIRQILNNADVVMLNGLVVDENLTPKGQMIFEAVKVRRGFFNNLLKNSFVGCCMAFKKDVLKVALPFPKNIPWHDWYIGLIGELLFHVQRFEQPTILYRRHGNNYSPTGEKSGNNLIRKLAMRYWIVRALVVAVGRYYFFRTKS